MKDGEAYEKALQDVERDPNGGIDEKKLIDILVEFLDFDVDEKRKKAERIIHGRRKPGSTQPHGQLTIPGFDAYAYEPNRLIADNDGHVIEQFKAPVTYKQAQATRTRVTARRWADSADRAQEEATGFSNWVIAGLESGRKAADLTFSHFIRATDIWSPTDPAETS